MPGPLLFRRAAVGRAGVALGRFAVKICAALTLAGAAHASVGLATIAATDADGRVTVFYPADAPAQTVQRGPFTFALAPDAPPVRGNGHLVVVSHGSGGTPWVHADLARELVGAGFVVAFPEHRRDNARDPSGPGPESWTIRPGEVSRAIDAVGRDARFAPLLALDRVGMYGMSAGGHTALSLAGGQWSPAGFARHCDADIAADFQSCVGLITQLTGGPLDAVRKWVARAIIRQRFADATPRRDGDRRIAAIVAAVPAAADFDMGTLASPGLPLGIVSARGDRWLVPRFHSDAVLRACARCEHLADVDGGHGALLSPLPPGFSGIEGELLSDPPGFDRAAATATVDAAITSFFRRHLLVPAP